MGWHVFPEAWAERYHDLWKPDPGSLLAFSFAGSLGVHTPSSTDHYIFQSLCTFQCLYCYICVILSLMYGNLPLQTRSSARAGSMPGVYHCHQCGVHAVTWLTLMSSWNDMKQQKVNCGECTGWESLEGVICTAISFVSAPPCISGLNSLLGCMYVLSAQRSWSDAHCL